MNTRPPESTCNGCRNSSRKLKEYCGVFAAYNIDNAAELTYYGLYALQHRGQESAGIVTTDGEQIYFHRGTGLVSDIFRDSETIEKLKGRIAIGHNRYSTTGSSNIQNVQPLTTNFKDGFLAIGHNGNLVNTIRLRQELENDGAIFNTTTDTEVILHLIARSKFKRPEDKIADAVGQIEGAFCLVILINDEIYAARDTRGYRPLSLGRHNGSWLVASETCAFDIVKAEHVRDIEPGEIIRINKKGVTSFKPFPSKQHQKCVFELIYFSRPDSKIFNLSVDRVRRVFGKRLAIEHPAPGADMVISVPDSSNSAALGFSEQSGIPLELGLIRNHYVGRTFIHPSQSIRDINARIKYNPVSDIMKDKSVVVVDDSIVRGTTSKRLIKMIRQAGAREIHFRVSSPPIQFPCFYGIDMPTRAELIGSSHTVDEIAKYLTVDSLGYLSIDGMFLDDSMEGSEFCTACFSGKYAVGFEKNFHKDVHEFEQSSLLENEEKNK